MRHLRKDGGIYFPHAGFEFRIERLRQCQVIIRICKVRMPHKFAQIRVQRIQVGILADPLIQPVYTIRMSEKIQTLGFLPSSLRLVKSQPLGGRWAGSQCNASLSYEIYVTSECAWDALLLSFCPWILSHIQGYDKLPWGYDPGGGLWRIRKMPPKTVLYSGEWQKITWIIGYRRSESSAWIR